MFFKIIAPKNFAKIPQENNFVGSLFQSSCRPQACNSTETQVFFCECCKIFKKTIFIEDIRWLLLKNRILCVITTWCFWFSYSFLLVSFTDSGWVRWSLENASSLNETQSFKKPCFYYNGLIVGDPKKLSISSFPISDRFLIGIKEITIIKIIWGKNSNQGTTNWLTDVRVGSSFQGNVYQVKA